MEDSYQCPATFYSRRGKPPTTIDAEELNGRVRHGNGCDLFAIATGLFRLPIICALLRPLRYVTQSRIDIRSFVPLLVSSNHLMLVV